MVKKVMFTAFTSIASDKSKQTGRNSNTHGHQNFLIKILMKRF